MGIAYEINRPESTVVRKAYIKRRNNTTGLYESAWFEITEYVKDWGAIQQAIDAVKLNNFKHSGISIKCRNDDGKFNPETHAYSFWYGYMTRFRTLLKIEAGYEDDDGNILPTNPSQGVFILTNDIPINAKSNDVTLNFKSLVSMFEEELVTNVPGMGATATASEYMGKIRDYTDGSGNLIFRQIISNASWIIQTTTTNYNPATSTSLDGMTCWGFMNKMAEAEGYVLLINRLGQFEFRDREERTSTSAFDFYGQGFRNMNIISLNEYTEPINTYYNYFRLKFLVPDTSTSYVTAGTITTIAPSSTAWQYGNRIYEFENTFIPNTAAAQAIVNARQAQFGVIKEELKATVNMCPQLELLDKVTFSHRSYNLSESTVWDTFDWDEENWADEVGEIFEWDNVGFKIISKKQDLDKMTMDLTMRRL